MHTHTWRVHDTHVNAVGGSREKEQKRENHGAAALKDPSKVFHHLSDLQYIRNLTLCKVYKIRFLFLHLSVFVVEFRTVSVRLRSLSAIFIWSLWCITGIDGHLAMSCKLIQ